MVVDNLVVGLIILDYYMIGQRICLNNFKSAGGLFEADKYIALLQAVVNLVASILLVNLVGLQGVYWGTIIQGTISSIAKPILVYKDLFGVSSKEYFLDSLKYGLSVFMAFILCWLCRIYLLNTVTIMRFVVMMGIVIIIPNTIFITFFHNRREFSYLKGLSHSIKVKLFSRH